MTSSGYLTQITELSGPCFGEAFLCLGKNWHLQDLGGRRLRVPAILRFVTRFGSDWHAVARNGLCCMASWSGFDHFDRQNGARLFALCPPGTGPGEKPAMFQITQR